MANSAEISTPEELFNSSRLEILVPEERVDIDSIDTEQPNWYKQLSSSPQRAVAFFDERLYLLLTVKLPNKAAPLASLLQRLQVSLDSSYISPFVPSSSTPRSPRTTLSAQPYGSTVSKLRQTVPLIPPSTPTPTPNTSTPDKPYAHTDSGVNIQSYIWGDEPPFSTVKNAASNAAEAPVQDRFMIAWSGDENAWIAIYELHVSVTFLQTRVSEPLLCLTVSATLRDKVLLPSSRRNSLISSLTEKELYVESPSQLGEEEAEASSLEELMDGMEEVNLLDVLSDGVTFSGSENSLSLDTTRVGSSFRREGFSLPPLTSVSSPTDLDHSPPSRSTVLRKSFRKTLRTVEGVKVRMRNCFVPYVSANLDDPVSLDDDENVGGEERTVVLSVEIENASSSGLSFVVERVEITVSGEGASARLIGWGSKPPADIFPFVLSSNDQANLLYNVTFLSTPEVMEAPSKRQSVLSSFSNVSADGMQRHVAIAVEGHPFRLSDGDQEDESPVNLESFTSRWNCVLDLLATQQADPNTWYARPPSPLTARDALPTPASPFPSSMATYQIRAGSVIPSQGGFPSSKSNTSLPPNSRNSTGAKLSAFVSPTGKFIPSPPSAVVAAMNSSHGIGSPTPRSDQFPLTINGTLSPVPPTPAFPAYPEGLPPSPYGQSPQGSIFDSATSQAESRRERMGSAFLPSVERYNGLGQGAKSMNTDSTGNMLVTVTLLPPAHTDSSVVNVSGVNSILPMDVFSLEIFLLNKSNVVRRCEIAFPEPKRRRNGTDDSPPSTPGVMPLDNRIRIGPLLPGACQSVRMHVLALRPGIHMIETLTLTDVTTGYSMNLRSVMNVVVEGL